METDQSSAGKSEPVNAETLRAWFSILGISGEFSSDTPCGSAMQFPAAPPQRFCGQAHPFAHSESVGE
jgi:hypothetical protein